MPEASTLTIFTLLPAALLYLVAAGRQLTAGQANAPASPHLIGLVALFLHFIGLSSALLVNHSLSSSFFDALSFTALIVVIATLSAQWKQPTRIILVPLYSLSALFILLSLFLGHYRPIEAPSYGVLLHVISSITAYALLCAAALYAALLWFTDHHLRGHDKLWSNALPPLQQTESTLFRLITSGWLLLTLAIISGLVSFENFFAQHLAHKTAFSLLSWLLFSILLVGHRLSGWRGRFAANWTLGGFAALVLAYLGSKFVLDILLHKL